MIEQNFINKNKVTIICIQYKIDIKIVLLMFNSDTSQKIHRVRSYNGFNFLKFFQKRLIIFKCYITAL